MLTINATVREIIDCIRETIPDLRVELVDTPVMNQLSYTVACEKFAGRGFRARGDLRAGVWATIELLPGLAASAAVLPS